MIRAAGLAALLYGLKLDKLAGRAAGRAVYRGVILLSSVENQTARLNMAVFLTVKRGKAFYRSHYHHQPIPEQPE